MRSWSTLRLRASAPAESLVDVVEDAIPLVDVPVSIRLDAEPVSVTLEPEGRGLPVEWADGYATVRVSTADGHAMVVACTR